MNCGENKSVFSQMDRNFPEQIVIFQGSPKFLTGTVNTHVVPRINRLARLLSLSRIRNLARAR